MNGLRMSNRGFLLTVFESTSQSPAVLLNWSLWRRTMLGNLVRHSRPTKNMFVIKNQLALPLRNAVLDM